jgi:hypothetical protein
MLIYLLVCSVCSRTFPHQRRDLSHCWQLCGVSAFAVGGRAVSGRAGSRTPAGACGLPWLFRTGGGLLPHWLFRTGGGLLPHWLFRTGGGLLPHWLFRRSVAAVAWVV